MKSPNSFPRRQFLKTLAAGALLLSPATAFPVERYQRGSGHIKDVGLTTYSLRSRMRYVRGRETDGDMEIVDFLEHCAANGIDTAELTAYYFKPDVKKSELHDIRRRAHLLGIDLAAGAIGNNFSHRPKSSEAEQQLQYTRDWIDRFAEMGIPVVRIFAGNPPRGMSADEALENVIANLETALVHAESRGILLGIENHDFTMNIDRLLEILSRIDSKWLGVTFDSGNHLSTASDPYGDLARIAPYAVSAQLKTLIRVNGKQEPVDFSRVIRILKDADYRGYVILEYEDKEDPKTAIPRALGEIRAALAR